jgi:serine palmitoyltransferase
MTCSHHVHSNEYARLFQNDASMQAEDVKALQHYGVGSCGPRGFYGTIDAHQRLEEALAAFMGTAEAIIYAFDIATMPSVLPAFTTKKDILVMDEAASWPLRNGASLSRAQGKQGLCSFNCGSLLLS